MTGHRPPATGRRRRTLLAITLAVGVLCGVAAAASPGSASQAAPRAASRIISLVPAVTEMLFAIGAGPRVVAVSSFDHFPPAIETLPRVGALLNPDTERILALRPDLVVTYGSQTDLEASLARTGIGVYSYRHGGVAGLLRTIRELGPLTGTGSQAEDVAEGLDAAFAAIRRRVANKPRPRTLLVFNRQPGNLRGVYAAGGVGFMHDLLDIAGGANVFADMQRESVQPSQELLLVRRPDIIVEVSAAAADAREAFRAWSVLGSLPAVRTGRIHALSGAYLVVPGPRLAQAAQAIARAVHPASF